MGIEDKTKRILKEGPGCQISLTVDFFDIKEEFLKNSGWSLQKYGDIVKGEWLIPLYELESKNIVKGLSQAPSAIKFWEEKARNWVMNISEHMKTILNSTLNTQDKNFMKVSIPTSLADLFPLNCELYIFSHKVTTSSGYVLIYEIGGEKDFMEISFSKLISIVPFLRELLVISDRYQELGEEHGTKMSSNIWKYCAENDCEL